MLRYPFFESDCIAFSTQRAGGVSLGSYSSFNANPYCGDDPEHVSRNREILCRQLGIAVSGLIIPHQTHSTHILGIDEAFLHLPESERRERLEDVDAVFTDIPGVCVCVSTADCIPILLLDAASHRVAAIHAGWRGTCARIVEKTLELWKHSYHCNPAQVKAVIGPGISLDAFEVGSEVYEAFSRQHFPMHSIARRYSALGGGEKWHLDLWECNRLQLLDQGVPETQIQVVGICTYKEYESYFSARRLGIKSGRILTGIFLRN